MAVFCGLKMYFGKIHFLIEEGKFSFKFEIILHDYIG